MAPEPATGKHITTDDKFQFLIACMKYTTDGKTDWEAVIEDQEIVTVNAAKRLSRMMAQHGLSERSLTALQSPKKAKRGGGGGGGSPRKKRKAVDMHVDEEEDNSDIKHEAGGGGGLEDHGVAK